MFVDEIPCAVIVGAIDDEITIPRKFFEIFGSESLIKSFKYDIAVHASQFCFGGRRFEHVRLCIGFVVKSLAMKIG